MGRRDDLHPAVWFVLEISGRLCITQIILQIRPNEHIISKSATSQNSIGQLIKCRAVVPRPTGNEVAMSTIYDLYTSRKPVLMIAMKYTQKTENHWHFHVPNVCSFNSMQISYLSGCDCLGVNSTLWQRL